MDKIEELIKIYTSSAENLRKVADIASQQGTLSDVAATSRAKAATYDLVIHDLKAILEGKGN